MISSLKQVLWVIGITAAIFFSILWMIRAAGFEIMIPYSKKWWEEWRKNR